MGAYFREGRLSGDAWPRLREATTAGRWVGVRRCNVVSMMVQGGPSYTVQLLAWEMLR